MKLVSTWLRSGLVLGCLTMVLVAAGCGGVSNEPVGADPVVEPPPTEEYIEGEKAIQ